MYLYYKCIYIINIYIYRYLYKYLILIPILYLYKINVLFFEISRMVFSVLHIIHSKSIGIPIIVIIYNITVLIRIRRAFHEYRELSTILCMSFLLFKILL